MIQRNADQRRAVEAELSVLSTVELELELECSRVAKTLPVAHEVKTYSRPTCITFQSCLA